MVSRARLKQRNTKYMKPEGFTHYLTLSELSLATDKDARYLRRLEAANRIPKAKRVQVGQLSVRLWSPNQVNEIHDILSRMKRGRPSNG